jgi:prolycopene isomerase
MMNQTLLEFLDEYSLSQPAIALWTQLSAFLGVEPSNLSALMFVVMWVDYYMHGYYYFEGGSGSLTQAMAEVVEENGGQVRLGAKATKIDVADNVASVVHTQRDACFSGRYIVSNANAPDTLLNMVGADKLPADYVQRLNEMTIGLSTFEVYLGVDADLTAAFSGSHEIMVSETFDTDENMGWVRDGNADMAPFAICNYSVVDPTAAPAGKNVIGITSQLPYEYQNTWRWNESYDSYIDLKTEIGWKYIERAEQYVPGLTDHIEVMEVQTPVTVQGYTLNPRGTIFGWDHTVDQTFAGRLANQTPIDNLLLVGAWTNPGAGQSAVIIGGTMVAEKILKKEGITPRNR